MTRTGTILGTPHYMAPEVWRGDGATTRSDIYSLGVVLYRLCTGHDPYCEERSLRSLRRAVAERDPPPLRREAREVDPGLAEVIHRCLRRDPAERFASAEELEAALADAIPWIAPSLGPGTESRRIMERVTHGPIPDGTPGVSPGDYFRSAAFRTLEDHLAE